MALLQSVDLNYTGSRFYFSSPNVDFSNLQSNVDARRSPVHSQTETSPKCLLSWTCSWSNLHQRLEDNCSTMSSSSLLQLTPWQCNIKTIVPQCLTSSCRLVADFWKLPLLRQLFVFSKMSCSWLLIATIEDNCSGRIDQSIYLLNQTKIPKLLQITTKSSF